MLTQVFSNPLHAYSEGEVLRILRESAGLTQAQLGQSIGYSVAAISRFETDQRRVRLQLLREHYLPAIIRHTQAASIDFVLSVIRDCMPTLTMPENFNTLIK